MGWTTYQLVSRISAINSIFVPTSTHECRIELIGSISIPENHGVISFLGIPSMGKQEVTVIYLLTLQENIVEKKTTAILAIPKFDHVEDLRISSSAQLRWPEKEWLLMAEIWQTHQLRLVVYPWFIPLFTTGFIHPKPVGQTLDFSHPSINSSCSCSSCWGPVSLNWLLWGSSGGCRSIEIDARHHLHGAFRRGWFSEVSMAMDGWDARGFLFCDGMGMR